MANYETTIIFRQDLSANQVSEAVDQTVEYLTSMDCKIARREYWGLKSLAYRIKKNAKGHYVLLNFTGNGAIVDEIERRFRLSDSVLRFMTVATSDLPSEPSVMMRRQEIKPKRYQDKDYQDDTEGVSTSKLEAQADQDSDNPNNASDKAED